MAEWRNDLTANIVILASLLLRESERDLGHSHGLFIFC